MPGPLQYPVCSGDKAWTYSPEIDMQSKLEVYKNEMPLEMTVFGPHMIQAHFPCLQASPNQMWGIVSVGRMGTDASGVGGAPRAAGVGEERLPGGRRCRERHEPGVLKSERKSITWERIVYVFFRLSVCLLVCFPLVILEIQLDNRGPTHFATAQVPFPVDCK